MNETRSFLPLPPALTYESHFALLTDDPTGEKFGKTDLLDLEASQEMPFNLTENLHPSSPVTDQEASSPNQTRYFWTVLSAEEFQPDAEKSQRPILHSLPSPKTSKPIMGTSVLRNLKRVWKFESIKCENRKTARVKKEILVDAFEKDSAKKVSRPCSIPVNDSSSLAYSPIPFYPLLTDRIPVSSHTPQYHSHPFALSQPYHSQSSQLTDASLPELKLVPENPQYHSFPVIGHLGEKIANQLLDRLATESEIEKIFDHFPQFKVCAGQRADYLLRYLLRVHIHYSKEKQSHVRANQLVKLSSSLIEQGKMTTTFAFYLLIKMLCVIAKNEEFPKDFIKSLRGLCRFQQELLLSNSDTKMLGEHLELCQLYCAELGAQLQPKFSHVVIENFLFKFSELFTRAPLKVQQWLDLSYINFIYAGVHDKLGNQVVEGLEKAVASTVQGKGFNLFHEFVLAWADLGYLYPDGVGKARLIQKCTALLPTYLQKLSAI